LDLNKCKFFFGVLHERLCVIYYNNLVLLLVRIQFRNSKMSGIIGMFENMIRPIMTAFWIPSMYTMVGSISLVLAMWTRMDIMQDEQFKPPAVEKFDFIVGKLSK